MIPVSVVPVRNGADLTRLNSSAARQYLTTRRDTRGSVEDHSVRDQEKT